MDCLSTNNAYTGLSSPLFVWLSHIIKLLCQYQLVEGRWDILKLGLDVSLRCSHIHLNLDIMTIQHLAPTVSTLMAIVAMPINV